MTLKIIPYLVGYGILFVAVFVAVLVCFSWMMTSVINYTRDLIGNIPSLLQ